VNPGPGLFVLITASRTWEGEQKRGRWYPNPGNRDRMFAALQTCLDRVHTTGGRLTLMHGGARGGDTLAGEWTREQHRAGHPVDLPLIRNAYWKAPCRDTCTPGHRVTWEDSGATTCPRAGYYRNEDMVNEVIQVTTQVKGIYFGRPAVMLAFIHQQSGGATHCYEYGKRMGLAPIPFVSP
jgi:hypothetical protein